MIDSATILTAIRDALLHPVQDMGGSLSVSGTVDDTLEVLANAPRGWRLIIQLNGDEALKEGYGSGVASELLAIVQAPRGLKLPPGANAHAQAAGLEFLSLLDWSRQLLRGLIFCCDPVDAPAETVAEVGARPNLEYMGWQWWDIDEMPTRQAAMRFRFVWGLPPEIPTFALLPRDTEEAPSTV